jgi:hypothetical protein
LITQQVAGLPEINLRMTGYDRAGLISGLRLAMLGLPPTPSYEDLQAFSDHRC